MSTFKLNLPKHSGVIRYNLLKILYNNNNEMDKLAFNKECYNKSIKQRDTNAEIERFWGLINFDKNKKIIELTELGVRFYESDTIFKKIDVIFDSIDSVTFGRNSNVLKSDSSVEAPVVFLKYILDFDHINLHEFALLLYLMEGDKLSYEKASKIVNNGEYNINYIPDNVRNKLLDTKIHLLLKDIEIVYQHDKDFKLTDYVKNNYTTTINDLDPLNKFEDDLNTQIKTPNSKVLKEDSISETFSNYFISPINKSIRIKKSRLTKKINSSKKTLFKKRNKDFKINQSISNYDKNLIGWTGEYKIYSHIINRNPILIDGLKIKRDEIIKEVNWFNRGFEDNYSTWEDKSVGNGCDIIIKTNLREIFIEVKSSWNLGGGIYTITRNELGLMLDKGNDYFIFKLNKLRNCLISEVDEELYIIQNPVKLNEYDKIKEITLWYM